jgi:uncharacterized protein YndB with AHSA1/START domain
MERVTHSTFVIERNYPAPPERVFAAFSDPAKRRRWNAEHQTMTVEEFRMDFRVGGGDLVRYRFNPGSPFPGAELTNQNTYQEIVVNQRIVFAYSMAFGDRRFSVSLVTFEFLPAASGTDLIFTEQGAFFEGGDGPERRREGWGKLLDKLAAEFV